MNVLIISAYPPDPAPEANHALHISECLACSGHTVQVVCKKGSIAATLPGIVIHSNIDEWNWSNLPRLVRHLKKCRPDVVLLIYIGWIYRHHPMITFLPSICRSVLPGVPVVTQFEAIDDDPLTRSVPSRIPRKLMSLWAGAKDIHWLFGTLLRDSARIIALSGPHRDRLNRHTPGIGEKIALLPPPPLIRLCPDRPEMDRQRARTAIGATVDDFVLVYWGYIYPGKGVETLLEAFRMVCTRNPNMRLVLVGGCLEIPTKAAECRRYYDMVRKLPETFGISKKVTWTGTFSWDSDEGSFFMRGSDACVLPFDYGVTLNNSSLAAATTHGLPVIATELSNGRDESLKHGRNTYLCPPKDPDSLAEAIELVSGSKEFQHQLRIGSLELAQEWYRREKMGDRLVDIFASAITSAGPSGRAGEIRLDEAADRAANPFILNGASSRPRASIDSIGDVLEQENLPLVSIVVAAYNVETYLSHCLDSLVHQTLKNIEVLVINDASTDNSGKIAHEYAAKHACVRVFDCETNRGLASVRNIGLNHATGQYIAFTDGDDWADVRMCEVLYNRAAADDLDVLVADATVLYETSKTFGEHFDKHIRQSLDPRLRKRPFEVCNEPRALLLEPVAWTKIYKRSFIQTHGMRFEEGMNSYEDICFHFWVLLKANKISLIDQPFLFYRQNRPGQISGRTNRKIFEVFEVFRKIHDNLTAWNVSEQVWAMLIKVQLRQFDWMLKDRVQSSDRREFMTGVAEAFKKIPEIGYKQAIHYTNPHERLMLFCMRRNSLSTYQSVSRHRWPLHPLLEVYVNHPGRGVVKRSIKRCLSTLQHRTIVYCRSLISRAMSIGHLETKLHVLEAKVDHLINIRECTSAENDPLTEVCKLGQETLFFSYPSYRAGLADAIWRAENDYYLTRVASFREGDTVIDVGAHVGVLSIMLAKKYPFLKIYALEPDPLNYASLMQNIERNGIKNVIALQMALSGDEYPRMLYTSARESSWATMDAGMISSQRVLRSGLVDTITLEGLFRKFDIVHCRLLKVTALGATHRALESFQRRGSIDLLCGEIDLRECSKARLEMISWQIARQHFWRTIPKPSEGGSNSWMQQLPRNIESLVPSLTPGGGLGSVVSGEIMDCQV
ncbi:MAG: putative Glycosyl transferase, group 1 [Nitrospira sp.]|jgi:FkbM family methyltransferase|nr:putative Glycosyl transferase, group 1 [Nitrospira sp.]